MNLQWGAENEGSVVVDRGGGAHSFTDDGAGEVLCAEVIHDVDGMRGKGWIHSLNNRNKLAKSSGRVKPNSGCRWGCGGGGITSTAVQQAMTVLSGRYMASKGEAVVASHIAQHASEVCNLYRALPLRGGSGKRRGGRSLCLAMLKGDQHSSVTSPYHIKAPHVMCQHRMCN